MGEVRNPHLQPWIARRRDVFRSGVPGPGRFWSEAKPSPTLVPIPARRPTAIQLAPAKSGWLRHGIFAMIAGVIPQPFDDDNICICNDLKLSHRPECGFS